MTLKDEPRSRKIKSQTILFKTGLIVIITLILLYPSSKINNLITESQLTKEETTLEIGKNGGNIKQSLVLYLLFVFTFL